MFMASPGEKRALYWEGTLLKRSTKRTTMLLGALLAGAISLGTPATAFAVESGPAFSSQAAGPEAGYRATLVVVSETGAESVTVNRSDLTVGSVLTARGYSPESFKDEKGNQLQLDLKLKNEEKVVVYSSTVSGTSETIELKLPDERIEDPNFYEGEVIVESDPVVGSALKTTVVHRDLSKVTQGPGSQPESLDAAALTAESTQTAEEVYLTVLTAPVAGKVTVGTKPCGSQYLCDLLQNGGLASLKISGPYVHPLGGARDWTTYTGSRGHEAGAIDFPITSGTPIYAVTDGTVVDSGYLGAGGNMVAIQHIDGTVTGYAHMVELPLVKKGDEVKTGQIIGFVGSTGRSTGPHLHFEVWKDHIWGEVIPSYEYMKLHSIELGPCVGGPCELSKKD